MKLSSSHTEKQKLALHNPHLKRLRQRLEQLNHTTTGLLPALFKLVNQYQHSIVQTFKANQNCYLCAGKSQRQICQWCVNDMPTLASNSKYTNLLNSPAIADAICHQYFDRLFIPLSYEWPISLVLKDFKFAQKTWLVDSLNDMLTAHIQKAYAEQTMPEAILPVPIHNKRYAQRMYNQASLLAQEVGLTLKLPVLHQHAFRTRNTTAQTELTGKQRRTNTSSAFSCADMQPWQHIAIIDDVVTTGATVNALAQTLKKSNPKLKIDIWALAISI